MSYILQETAEIKKPTHLEEYYSFLEKKIDTASWQGFEVSPEELHPALYPHQRDSVIWALKMGRALLAKYFSMGKTVDQVEIAQQIVKRFGGKFLQVCTLGAKHVFEVDDGPRLGVHYEFVQTDEEIYKAKSPFLITNYESIREGKIDPRLHPEINGISLDEGDVIRSLGSKTFQVFDEVCANIIFRFIATATPNPQNVKELIYFAHWLGIADAGQLLTKYFQRDPDQAGNLTLMAHQAEKFYLWLASWALFLYEPGDLGYSNEGYTKPKVRVHWHRIPTDYSRAGMDNRGQYRLVPDAGGGVSEAAREKQATIPERIAKMLEIMRDYDPVKAGKKTKGWLLWHDLEPERWAIEKAVPAARTVYGSQKLEDKEALITAFSRGEFDILATKPRIAGSGCNFQYHCADAIFLGVGWKFKDYIQAFHRIVRYQQKEVVDLHFVYTESEDGVVNKLKERWANFDEQTERMRQIIKANGLTHRALEANLKRTMGVNRQEVKGHLFSSILNDCVIELIELVEMLDNRDWQGLKARVGHLVEVGPENIEELTRGFFKMILTSIPFGNHFQYSEQYEDFGYNISDAIFWEQMDFLIPLMLRLLEPGRVAPIHVKDRVLYGHQTGSGFMEIGPFSDQCVMAFTKHGWMYEGRRTIVTDVVRENNSTYRLGWSECTEGDSAKMGAGMNEYILLFRKPPSDHSTARADVPVTKEKYKVLSCVNCDHELQGDEFPDLDRNLYGTCPNCEERTRFNVVEFGYSRGRWQLDASGFWRSSGNRLLTPSETYDYEANVTRMEAKERTGNLPSSSFHEPPQSSSEWVWTDVNFMHGLNSYQFQKGEEQHLCPLPFDVVKRCIRLYSNPGDLILEMFAGLGTVGYCAIELDRKCYMTELHPPYWSTNVKYCQDAEIKALVPNFFHLLEEMAEQAPEPAAGLEAWLERNYPALLDEYRGRAEPVKEVVLVGNGNGAHA